MTRIRVLTGGAPDPWGAAVVAFSECRYVCPDRTVLDACLRHMRESDERFRGRKGEGQGWDRSDTWVVREPGGGFLLHRGLVWYDAGSFTECGEFVFGAIHRRLYERLGVPDGGIAVRHWIASPGGDDTGAMAIS
jgi:hypothetical protein